MLQIKMSECFGGRGMAYSKKLLFIIKSENRWAFTPQSSKFSNITKWINPKYG